MNDKILSSGSSFEVAFVQKQLSFMSLLKAVFTKHEMTKQDKRLEHGLLNKTLFSSFCFSLVRIYGIIVRRGTWFEDKVLCVDLCDKDCLQPYNNELTDPFEPFFRSALAGLCIFNAVITLISFKWRWLMHWFIYIEASCHICAILVPSVESQQREYISSFYLGLVVFVFMGTWQRAQIYMVTITVLITMIVNRHTIYLRPMTIESMLVIVITTLALFLILVGITMVLHYISRLHKGLDMLNIENKKLFSRMHEGTLILSKKLRKA